MIELQNLSKHYPNKPQAAVSNFSLSIKKGETIALIGSSGCGKSTLLKMINRLIEPTSGSIRIQQKNTQDIPLIQLRRSIGYVFQKCGLLPHLTIEKNIKLPMQLIKKSKHEQNERVKVLMQLINLSDPHILKRYPDELSGGQQQRIGVARALATNPDILLMDEPFGALDAISRNTLQQEVIRIKNELGKTIILVTHDIEEAFLLGDRIVVMHEGNLVQCGTKQDLLNHPANEFVSQLLTHHVSSS